jgi:MHS family proline/betaine transporter-like MFS transporter
VKEAVTVNLKETAQATLFASGYGAVFYISLVYVPTWLGEYSLSSKGVAMNFNTVTTALVIFLAPVAGWLSDKYIRRTKLLAIVFFFEAILAVPLFLWMKLTGGVFAVAVSQFLMGTLIAFPCGIAPSVFVELFPTEDRLSGYSIAFNLGIGVIGGSTPMAATWLISNTDLIISPGIYMSAWAFLAVIALLWMKDRSREPLRKR